jgi:hypothetical protein
MEISRGSLRRALVRFKLNHIFAKYGDLRYDCKSHRGKLKPGGNIGIRGKAYTDEQLLDHIRKYPTTSKIREVGRPSLSIIALRFGSFLRAKHLALGLPPPVVRTRLSKVAKDHPWKRKVIT